MQFGTKGVKGEKEKERVRETSLSARPLNRPSRARCFSFSSYSVYTFILLILSSNRSSNGTIQRNNVLRLHSPPSRSSQYIPFNPLSRWIIINGLALRSGRSFIYATISSRVTFRVGVHLIVVIPAVHCVFSLRSLRSVFRRAKKYRRR